MNCTKCSRIVSNNGLDICLNCLGGFDNVFGLDDGKYDQDEDPYDEAEEKEG